MSNDYFIGDKVELSYPLEEYKNKTGIVTRVGAWNIYDVKWDGIDCPISMRGDEIRLQDDKTNL